MEKVLCIYLLVVKHHVSNTISIDLDFYTRAEFDCHRPFLFKF